MKTVWKTLATIAILLLTVPFMLLGTEALGSVVVAATVMVHVVMITFIVQCLVGMVREMRQATRPRR